jgi:hypothetical protein
VAAPKMVTSALDVAGSELRRSIDDGQVARP